MYLKHPSIGAHYHDSPRQALSAIGQMQPIEDSLNVKLAMVLGSTGVLKPGMEARIMRDDGTNIGI
jgi:hypothetical protein